MNVCERVLNESEMETETETFNTNIFCVLNTNECARLFVLFEQELAGWFSAHSYEYLF